MPKPDQKKLCSNCKKTPLRSDNTSGICSGCRKAPAKGRAGAPTGEKAAAAPSRGAKVEVVFSGKPANALAVHRKPSGTRGWNYGESFLFQFKQSVGGDRLNLGNNVMRTLSFNYAAKLSAIKH